MYVYQREGGRESDTLYNGVMRAVGHGTEGFHFSGEQHFPKTHPRRAKSALPFPSLPPALPATPYPAT